MRRPFVASSGVLYRMDALAEERFPPPYQGAFCSAAHFQSRGSGAAACLGLVILSLLD